MRLAGFEPATFGSVDRCSIQLSYRRISYSIIMILLIIPNRLLKIGLEPLQQPISDQFNEFIALEHAFFLGIRYKSTLH